MTKHLFISSWYVLCFEWFNNMSWECYLELQKSSFDVQRKRSNEKIPRKKKSFLIFKMCFFFVFFLLFGALLLSNLITFLYLLILNNLRWYRKATWIFTNRLWTLIARDQYAHKKFGCSGTDFCNVWWFIFFEFLTSFILGDHNFLIFNLFSTIISVLDAPR